MWLLRKYFASSPHIMLLGLVAFWCAGISIAPITIQLDEWNTGVTVAILFILAFAFGSILVSLTLKRSNGIAAASTSVSSTVVLRITTLLIALTAVGVILRLIDLGQKGFEFGFFGLAEQRLGSLRTTIESASVISILAAAFSSFSLSLLVIVRLYGDRLPRTTIITCFLLGSWIAVESLFFRGGSAGLAYLIIFCFILFLSGDQHARKDSNYAQGNTRRGFRLASLMPWLLPVAVLIGGLVFTARIDFMYGSATTYIESRTSGAFYFPSDWLVSAIRENPDIASPLLIYYWIFDYLFQGPIEFVYVVGTFSEESHTHGASQFWVPTRLFSSLSGLPFDANSIIQANPRSGKFLTFLGDVFIDFGTLGGMTQMFIFGALCSYAHLKRQAGDIFWSFLDPLFKTFIIMGLMLNSFSGSRIYFVFGLLVAGIIAASIIMDDWRRRSQPSRIYGAR